MRLISILIYVSNANLNYFYDAKVTRGQIAEKFCAELCLKFCAELCLKKSLF